MDGQARKLGSDAQTCIHFRRFLEEVETLPTPPQMPHFSPAAGDLQGVERAGKFVITNGRKPLLPNREFPLGMFTPNTSGMVKKELT